MRIWNQETDSEVKMTGYIIDIIHNNSWQYLMWDEKKKRNQRWFNSIQQIFTEHELAWHGLKDLQSNGRAK